jgi:hypothetical protein
MSFDDRRFQMAQGRRDHLITKKNSTFLVIIIGLTLLAAALRFHSLGAWPYSADETATLEEESVLFHGLQVDHSSQDYRLPHLIPASYFVFHVSHSLFGLNEWGTRVLTAALGTLCVLLVFLLLDRPMNRTTALVTALLVALLPQHVLHSQEARFYMVATLFAFTTLLVGARILSTRGTIAALWTCALALMAILAHTLMVALLPLVFVAICAGAYAERRPVPRSALACFAGALVLAAMFFVWYIRPLVQGWNQGETWGYSPIHALFASIVMLGWPLSLLTVVGAVLMLRERSAQSWYWLACLAGWFAATLIFPFFVVYHAEYVFPLVLGPLVVAAYAISTIYRLLQSRNVAAARVWLALICLTNLPALASHYVDGSRRDGRTAATYVRDHWQAGDRVTGYSMGLFQYYSGGCCEAVTPLPLSDSVPVLEHLSATGGRLWVVLENTRWGLEPQTQQWLFDCAVHKFTVGGRRFDEADFKLEIYLVTPPLTPQCLNSARGPADYRPLR